MSVNHVFVMAYLALYKGCGFMNPIGWNVNIQGDFFSANTIIHIIIKNHEYSYVKSYDIIQQMSVFLHSKLGHGTLKK